ncbi:phenylacetate--CoA ligase family protein [Parapedobacter sp. 10938]|uniref:phenylacetate--CoA ligase family protein n=1 Tax=Parapedobacter flavus TaxID=3110225 RepID=UPI002DBCEB82|nr:AMP-binding protein [Parapedobacter sp. 10938]MEC3879318.1 AMP-binding protein [Parapedobacter sp. 10938]
MTTIPPIEQAPRETINQFQEERLQQLMAYLHAHSVHYQQVFQTHGIDAYGVRTLSDLAQLPFTTKEQLQQENAAFRCVATSQVADYVTTSGTSGDPVLLALTDKDLERLAYNESLSYQCMGMAAGQTVQLTTTLDRRFMAGLAYFLGARRAGIGVVRVGSGVPELQWGTIARVQPDALVCVPSFLLKKMEFAEANGIDYRQTSITKALCIGEPVRNPDFSLNALASRIRSKWDIQLFSTYASTEMATAFTECAHGVGGHHHPELIITEFVDEEGRPVAEGEPGELVVTTLGVEGMPLLRFKTGDIVQPHYAPCACGRTTLRLGPVIGRKNQMVKYKGTTLYPPALFDLLNDMEEIVNYVIEIASDEFGEDEITVQVGTGTVSDELLLKIKDRFRAKLRVSPKIVFAPIDDINRMKFPENSRKSVTLFDRRIVQ